ncbi:hypothetical protein M422DRAFT_268771 [Sphaerobolus stellatus SS14]|uniref:Uncharacterized protein n=1 Tax=Sphaerobolus stellatus (strain SS14) TaxID=990650 RepID=A0A0C9TJD6_SPHS4|nr:hypothetical protein M422DRAFT_268771 [Sphaerobolus stellatus SS14]
MKSLRCLATFFDFRDLPSIMDCIMTLPNLEKLEVGMDVIEDDKFEDLDPFDELLDWIGQLNNLTHLTLGSICGFQVICDNAEIVVQLAALPRLQHVKLACGDLLSVPRGFNIIRDADGKFSDYEEVETSTSSDVRHWLGFEEDI